MSRLLARLLLRLASGLLAVTFAAFLLQPPVALQGAPGAYVAFLERLALFDLGTSQQTGRPVAADLLAALPASMALLALASVLGVGLGVVLALPGGLGLPGRLPRLLVTAVGSLPGYALALLLLLVFWYAAGWAPAPDGAGAGRAILPAVTLAVPAALAVARPLAFALATVMRQSYFAAARAAGLGLLAATVRHGLRNALPAAFAGIGLQVGMGLANLLVVERLFGWPGVGLYFTHALSAADRPAIVGASLALATLYMLVDIAAAAARALVDPRLRLP